MPVPDLYVKDLTLRSPEGRCLLSIDHLHVAAGESLAIKGPSGAGKSTLLFAIAGIIPVSSGTLAWGDADLAQMSDNARTQFRRDSLGIIFQDHLLFEELSAAQNSSLAALYNRPHTRTNIAARARQLLHDLGIKDHDRPYVDSYSGGERQRIAVARALAADPQVILADEPTASLDRETADRLIADLTRRAKHDGRTLICVSHDQALLAAADRVITIQEGCISADTGRHRDTRGDNDV